jgi:hypothetical protein
LTATCAHPYEISLIVPYYDPDARSCSELGERRPSAARQLLDGSVEHALIHCDDPSSVQLIVVRSRDDADGSGGDDNDLNDRSHEHPLANGTVRPGETSTSGRRAWGSAVHQDVRNRGRGPCLNHSAKCAGGRILVFCHADTKLPERWDASIRNAFGGARDRHPSNIFVLATAFSFGVDAETATAQSRRIPGLGAVVATANCRSRWYSLPYGDQCISVSASVFRHIGGYPDVPIMEDYELITFLRQREVASRADPDRRRPKQRIVVLPHRVRCSPRRWERHGVVHVTLTNSRLVRAYQSGQASAAEIYQRYYGVPCVATEQQKLD